MDAISSQDVVILKTRMFENVSNS